MPARDVIFGVNEESYEGNGAVKLNPPSVSVVGITSSDQRQRRKIGAGKHPEGREHRDAAPRITYQASAGTIPEDFREAAKHLRSYKGMHPSRGWSQRSISHVQRIGLPDLI
jgi:hypothetical protein